MKWTMESKMPFGKYKGEKLKTIDYYYMFWLVFENWFKGDLRQFIYDNLDEFPKPPRIGSSSGDMMSRSDTGWGEC